MKAQVLYPNGIIKFEEREIPTPSGGEVLIKVKRCGICMSDYYIYKGGFPRKGPVVLGHEFSGVIMEIGKGVIDFKKGDRVTVNPTLSCGYCEYCAQGKNNLCDKGRSIGGAGVEIIDGGFEEYTVVPQTNLGKLARDVTFEEGALTEPLGCAIRGIQQSRLSIGEKVLIVGAGPMGLLLLQLVKQYGASYVIVSEIIKERGKIAKKLGADIIISPKDCDVPQEVKKMTNGGVELAIEAVGRKKAAQDAYNSLRKGGRLLIFGVPPKDEKMEFELFPIYFYEHEIIGSYAITNDSFRKSLRMLNDHRIDIKSIITHILALEDLPKALKMQEDGIGLKKMISMDI